MRYFPPSSTPTKSRRCSSLRTLGGGSTPLGPAGMARGADTGGTTGRTPAFGPRGRGTLGAGGINGRGVFEAPRGGKLDTGPRGSPVAGQMTSRSSCRMPQWRQRSSLIAPSYVRRFCSSEPPQNHRSEKYIPILLSKTKITGQLGDNLLGSPGSTWGQIQATPDPGRFIPDSSRSNPPVIHWRIHVQPLDLACLFNVIPTFHRPYDDHGSVNFFIS